MSWGSQKNNICMKSILLGLAVMHSDTANAGYDAFSASNSTVRVGVRRGEK